MTETDTSREGWGALVAEARQHREWMIGAQSPAKMDAAMIDLLERLASALEHAALAPTVPPSVSDGGELIAEARKWACDPEHRASDNLILRLADALASPPPAVDPVQDAEPPRIAERRTGGAHPPTGANAPSVSGGGEEVEALAKTIAGAHFDRGNYSAYISKAPWVNRHWRGFKDYAAAALAALPPHPVQGGEWVNDDA